MFLMMEHVNTMCPFTNQIKPLAVSFISILLPNMTNAITCQLDKFIFGALVCIEMLIHGILL